MGVNFLHKYKGSVLVILLLCSTSAISQTVIKVVFEPAFQGQSLILNKQYYLPEINDSVQFSTLRFYLSGFSGVDSKGANTALKGKGGSENFHLLDLNVLESMQLNLAGKSINEIASIKFNLGVDSTTNYTGAHSGDLDPMHGMYWAWQSGYINFKLEGNSKTCTTRKNRFQFHIGGFQHPYNSFRSIQLKVPRAQQNITKGGVKTFVVQMELEPLLKKLFLSKNYHVMRPGAKAMEVATVIGDVFKVK